MHNSLKRRLLVTAPLAAAVVALSGTPAWAVASPSPTPAVAVTVNVTAGMDLSNFF